MYWDGLDGKMKWEKSEDKQLDFSCLKNDLGEIKAFVKHSLPNKWYWFIPNSAYHGYGETEEEAKGTAMVAVQLT